MARQWGAGAERGEKPDKPYSGMFVVQAFPDLHRGLSVEASRKHVSLNALATSKLQTEQQRHSA